MAAPVLVNFFAGEEGPWRIVTQTAVRGEPLPPARRLVMASDPSSRLDSVSSRWVLRGFTSNERYVERTEREQLVRRQEGLGRPSSRCAALIPIRKTAEWWDLTQDERRAVLEDRSRHIAIGLEHLPAIARRLHHSRDLDEPFDFLTWFEYAPKDAADFEELVATLRATEEWTYVDREVDLRLERGAHGSHVRMTCDLPDPGR